MQLRPERDGDHEPVREVHLRAFGPQDGPTVADLLDDLRALIRPGFGVSLVADDGVRVIGHTMTTRALLDAPRRLVEVLVLSPLGVLPDRQRAGIGSALVRRAIEIAGEQGAPLVFLEGSPSYYPRLGFAPGRPLGFRKPSLRIPDAAFQVIRTAAYRPWMTGTLVYPQTFWEHDAVGLREADENADR
jgi:putative acetyltransferase